MRFGSIPAAILLATVLPAAATTQQAKRVKVQKQLNEKVGNVSLIGSRPVDDKFWSLYIHGKRLHLNTANFKTGKLIDTEPVTREMLEKNSLLADWVRSLTKEPTHNGITGGTITRWEMTPDELNELIDGPAMKVTHAPPYDDPRHAWDKEKHLLAQKYSDSYIMRATGIKPESLSLLRKNALKEEGLPDQQDLEFWRAVNNRWKSEQLRRNTTRKYQLGRFLTVVPLKLLSPGAAEDETLLALFTGKERTPLGILTERFYVAEVNSSSTRFVVRKVNEVTSELLDSHDELVNLVDSARALNDNFTRKQFETLVPPNVKVPEIRTGSPIHHSE